MKRRIFTVTASAGIALVVTFGNGMADTTALAQGQGRVLPVFEVDAQFLKMPAGMVLGAVGGTVKPGA